MSVPIVICPCGEAVALLSVRHFTTIEVDDMDTCSAHRRQHQHYKRHYGPSAGQRPHSLIDEIAIRVST